MEGDIKNLRPIIGELNQDRSNYRFGMIEGERRRYGHFDFEVDFKLRMAEPPPEVRSEIAEIDFYMAQRYDLKFSKQQMRLLVSCQSKISVIH